MKLSHLVFSLLMAAPAAALAEPPAPSITVPYADLNLASPAGLKVLDRRLANAVRAVCQADDGTAIAERRFAEQRCVREKRAEVAGLRDQAVASFAWHKALASR